MKPAVYVETTVVSYYVARRSRNALTAERQRLTREWWKRALPKCEPFISAQVMQEINRGDAQAASRRVRAVAEMAVLEATVDVEGLAEEYFRQIDLPETSRADAYPLALACRHTMDYLVTWNCRHIAGGRVRRIVEQINALRSIHTPQICTPEELMEL